jgi:hypothetical protein
MTALLTAAQVAAREAFQSYCEQSLLPHAGRWDRERSLPSDLPRQLGARGYLAALGPREFGGAEVDAVTFGLLLEEVGRCCSSVRSLLTAHAMVVEIVARWASPSMRNAWLPKLCAGDAVGAFALTEPHAGSDGHNIQTTAVRAGAEYRLDGDKKWITNGQIADLFLVFARVADKPTAFLVEAGRPGTCLEPSGDVLGTRASHLAELRLDDCRVPAEHRVGGLGFGISVIAAAALDLGRYSVAWGCVGAARACLEASLDYADGREQFGCKIRQHQLVAAMLTDMVVGVKAARLLCLQAGLVRQAGDESAGWHASIAKYYASRQFARAAADAVQIHGASGCHPDFPVERFYRDSKVMEIIEGTSEIHQVRISPAIAERRQWL